MKLKIYYFFSNESGYYYFLKNNTFLNFIFSFLKYKLIYFKKRKLFCKNPIFSHVSMYKARY